MNLYRIPVGYLETNCYIVGKNDRGMVIDPGAEPEKIIESIGSLDVNIILITHNHFDHIEALEEVKEFTGAKACIYREDWIPGVDIKLKDGEIIEFCDLNFKVIHTPGHTSGSCCYFTYGYLFSGDTLFPGGPGNTSLPGGDRDAIFRSIRERLMVLPDSTRVLPGHGLPTTIGKERNLYC